MSAGRRIVMTVALVGALLAPGGRLVRGQDDAPGSGRVDLAAFGRGTEALRRILYDRGFRAAEGLDLAGRTLLVVLGDTAILELIEKDLGGAGGLRRFVEAGGALVVASDRRTPGSMLDEFGVGVQGSLLVLENPADGYLGLGECPQVLAATRGLPALFRPPLPPGVPPGMAGPAAFPRVAVNLPSRLELGRELAPGLSVLAVLPPGCRTRTQQLMGLTPPFAVGGRVGAGALLVLADHSILINDMILRPDNGNLDLAYRAAEWLKVGPDGPRDRVVYYEDGVRRTDFDIPLRAVPLPPLPPPEALVPVLAATLHGLEEENAFNRLLLHFVPLENIWRGLALAGAAALALYGFVRLGVFRYRADPGAPPLSWQLSQAMPSGPLMEARVQEQIRLGHFGEAMQALAAEAFAAVGMEPRAGEEQPAPVAVVSEGWWQRWLWRRRISRLWRLARGEARGSVSRRQLASVARNVRRLEAALADGTVMLEPAPEE